MKRHRKKVRRDKLPKRMFLGSSEMTDLKIQQLIPEHPASNTKRVVLVKYLN